LYPNELRLYNDVDLLVTPSQFDAASEVAEELGFTRGAPLPNGRFRRFLHANLESEERSLGRAGDAVSLDLHRSFHGLPVDFSLCDFLLESAQVMTVAGAAVSVPDPAGVGLVAVLHARARNSRKQTVSAFSLMSTSVLRFWTKTSGERLVYGHELFESIVSSRLSSSNARTLAVSRCTRSTFLEQGQIGWSEPIFEAGQ
jgi:Uncharacterised nucleotidyltransferase